MALTCTKAAFPRQQGKRESQSKTLTEPDPGRRLSVLLILLGSFCLRARLFGKAGGLRGGSYSSHLVLSDNSFKTNQILNKKK